MAGLLELPHAQGREELAAGCFVRIFNHKERLQVLWPDLKLCSYILLTQLPLNISDKFYVQEAASLIAFKTIVGTPEIESSRRLVL